MHSKLFAMRPVLIYSTFTLVVVSYMCSHSCLGANGQKVAVNLLGLKLNTHSQQQTTQLCFTSFNYAAKDFHSCACLFFFSFSSKG